MDCGYAEFADVTESEGYRRERGRVCGGTAEVSDPRLSGEVTFIDDADRYQNDNGFSDIVWGSITIENDDGTWEGRSVGTSDITAGGRGITYHELGGTGAYEGLSAVLFMPEDATGLPLSGVIFPGALTDDR